jgi:hypothetical protein
MNMHGRIEGASLRQRTTYDFGVAPPSPRALDLDYVRASGLAQVRLQLAVLSGNRRGALREVDRLVEIDRRLEALAAEGIATRERLSADLQAELDQQREAIASEKLALMAAVEFPRLAAAERAAEEPGLADESEIVIVEDTEFGRKLLRGVAVLLGMIALGTALAFALPALATL